MADSILVVVVFAIALMSLLLWRIKPSRFRALRWQSFSLASGIFWGVFAVVLYQVYWDSYYRYFALPYGRWLSPLAGLFYVLVGLGLRWLAVRIPGNPILNFCLLGALESIPEHMIGIYRFHILEIPILRDVSAGEIFVFAVFEYAIYWGIVLALAILIERFFEKMKSAG